MKVFNLTQSCSLGLVRFVPKSDFTRILIGQPVDEDLDVGVALRKGEKVDVEVFSGSSVLDPGIVTGLTETIHRILSPLAQTEVGTIRCVGLNVSVYLSCTICILCC